MTQSRLSSFVESVANVVIGYSIAIFSQYLIFPHYGIHIPLSSNIAIALWFSLISIVRSYAIRRWFNSRIHLFAQNLADRFDAVRR